MITGVRVSGFRSILHAEVELGRLTIIVGANGSGKTNLLEALAIVGAAAARKLDHEFLAARGIRPFDRETALSRFSDASTQNALMAVGAPLDFRETSTGISADSATSLFTGTTDRGVVAAKMIDRLQKMGADPGRLPMTSPDDWRELEEIQAEGRPPGLSSFLIYSPEYSALRTFADEGQILPLGIRGEGLFRHLVDLSKRVPDVVARIGDHLRVLDWFDSFVIPPDLGPGEKRLAIRDRYLAKNVLLDQRAANEGFLFLLFVYTLLLSPDTPRFFAVDNADASLNPSLCSRVVSDIATLAKEQDRQVILTTHNAAMLDGLDLSDPEQRLLVCERDLDGHTRFRAVPRPERLQINLSEAFLRGYLGGLPKSF